MLISKPHFHLPPSPSPPVRPKVPTPPYTKSIPTPYGRHTVSSIQEFLLSDSRGAWIIPVRGILPWQESTTASILKPITELSLAYSTQALSNNTPQGSNIDLPNGVSESGEIIWTQTSLVSFWNFLLTLRQANTLGPLSLSFHAAPSHPHSHAYSLSSPEYSLSSKGDDTGRNVLRSDSDDGAHLCRIPLLAVDHIKVYHDVEYAMLLRNVWDAWGFLPQVKGAEVVIDQNKWAGGDAKLKKIRILKGAKLVLVDERSKGVLLS